MRIAYVSLHWPRTRNSGVGKKIHSQVTAWQAMGHETRLFMHTSDDKPISDLIAADYFFFSIAGKIRTEINRIQAVKQMLSAIRKFRPDVIYLRYSIYVYPAHCLMEIAPVIEEINTNDLTQHEGLGGIYSLYNRLTRGIFLRSVSGLVIVSRELANSPAFTLYRKPSVVIANGVDLNSFDQLPVPENEIPHLVFIGNPGYTWHGVDKLVRLAKLIPDIWLDIVGYDELPDFEPLPNNMTLHGYLAMDDYKRVIGRADAAISSIALHRVQLEEASPLKSRECLAFGLPLIIAYTDTDLDDKKSGFLLKIPNQEDNVETHAGMIRDFLYKVRGKRVSQAMVMDLDQRRKELNRIEFFSEILHNR